jgi:hypothetical protein
MAGLNRRRPCRFGGAARVPELQRRVAEWADRRSEGPGAEHPSVGGRGDAPCVSPALRQYPCRRVVLRPRLRALDPATTGAPMAGRARGSRCRSVPMGGGRRHLLSRKRSAAACEPTTLRPVERTQWSDIVGNPIPSTGGVTVLAQATGIAGLDRVFVGTHRIEHFVVAGGCECGSAAPMSGRSRSAPRPVATLTVPPGTGMVPVRGRTRAAPGRRRLPSATSRRRVAPTRRGPRRIAVLRRVGVCRRRIEWHHAVQGPDARVRRVGPAESADRSAGRSARHGPQPAPVAGAATAGVAPWSTASTSPEGAASER